MGKLKPVGSEKLEGMDKISRIMEIARYNEYIPQPINENKSVEYSITLADGRNYQISKEKVGYVIKRSLNESVNEFEYLEPMKNRKHYSSYSEAFKRLNLIAKEVNTLTGYDKNVSLFTESDVDVKKYVLKMKEQAPAPEQTQAAPEQTQAAPQMPVEEPVPAPSEVPAEMPAEEPMMEPEMEPETEQNDEVITFKTIQKLTGKLGQKIREFLSNEENQMSSKDIKYVVNSVLSALDLNKLEEGDKEEIMSKFEGGEEVSEPEMEMEPEMEPEMGGEPTPEPVPAEEEMTEDFDMDDEPSFRKHRKGHHYTEEDEGMSAVEEMIEGMFSESKVDNILKKYFRIDEKEKYLMEEKKRKLTEDNKRKDKIKNRITNLSESISQEVSSKKLFSKYPNAKLIGKSQENNLIFEINNKRVRVTPKGSIK